MLARSYYRQNGGGLFGLLGRGHFWRSGHFRQCQQPHGNSRANISSPACAFTHTFSATASAAATTTAPPATTAAAAAAATTTSYGTSAPSPAAATQSSQP